MLLSNGFCTSETAFLHTPIFHSDSLFSKNAMIEAIDLTKFYGPRCVVDHVNFVVKPGDLLGFLGPNGAGKSTTMKMITGFLHPTHGRARIHGMDVSSHPIEARQRLGYLPENGPLYEEMTVMEFLEFISGIRNASHSRSDQLRAVEQVIERCQLAEVGLQTIDTLSKGYRQRVGLAQAILHDPEYLILDEPTDGLDPNQKHEIRQLLQTMAAEKAIIMSTHILEEVEAICNRVIIIANGRVEIDATPDALRERHAHFGGLKLVICGDPNQVHSSLASAYPQLRWLRTEAGHLIALPSNTGEILPTHGLIDPARFPEIREIHRAPTPLDEVFRSLTATQTERRHIA